jgi:transposase
LMPPAYVKPYVKRQKNDMADAEAICEAAPEPTCGSCQPRHPSSRAA